MTHDQLTKAAGDYLSRTLGCGVVFTELVTYAGEVPDAIGFRSSCSILVEVKVSRGDFLSDAKKSHRANPSMGMGDYRFYCAPKGVLTTADMPAGWGLIEASGNPEGPRLRRVHGPAGSPSTWGHHQREWRFEKYQAGEYLLMYSALRRLELRGRLPEIYEPLG